MIKESPESRIINVSSVAHTKSPNNFTFYDSSQSKTYFKKDESQLDNPSGNEKYAVSKLANIMFTHSMKKYLNKKGSKI